MYEYSVTFTTGSQKWCVLIKTANGDVDAIQQAITYAISKGKTFNSVEAVMCI